MSVYTVHEPPPRADEAAADPARFVFVRDGFHFWAMVLGPVWMLWHRLWLVLILYLLLSGVTFGGTWLLDTTWWGKVCIDGLMSILIGLEASTLRRWTLGRNNWMTVGVVAGEDAEDAERRFFDSWAGRSGRAHRPRYDAPASSPVSAPYAPPYPGPAGQQQSVIGLFPEPGGHR